MAKMYGLMRLGNDAELRHLPSGEAVVNMSLAYNYGKADEHGNRPTQWISAALWGTRAEKLVDFLQKGSLHLFTLSNVRMESYTDKDNFQAWKLSATVDDVELGPKRDGAAAPRPASAPGAAPQRRPAAPAGSPSAAPAAAASGFADMDDDIPF